MFNSTDQLAVNSIRFLSSDMIDKANSGHPGLPLGAAPMAYALWAGHLQQNPKDTQWVNRDRFVLSAGHGSAMLYALLHLGGFDVSIDDLKNFRQLNSKTPGHPEYGWTDGVEATTGPLGQGIANAVGMAMAEAHLAATYNRDDHKIVDHYTYTLVGDGDLMEGIAYEATSLAGRLELDKLIVLYDSNDISLDGDLSMSFKEDIKGRFEAINWNYIRVEDGNDLEEISAAIAQAKKADKPSLIEVKTKIGYGSPKVGTSGAHGAPLGVDGTQATRDNLKWEHEPFVIPQEVYDRYQELIGDAGQKAQDEWQKAFDAYAAAYPELAQQFQAAMKDELPENLFDALPAYEVGEDAKATRVYSSEAIQAIAKEVPYFWGGSADLSSSNNTMIADGGNFMPESYDERNIWYGVREFAMGAILNGIMLHGGSRSYIGTFFVFSDYLRHAIRVAALSHLPAAYVFTHDSVAVGEDGPTHEPIEHLASFRAMPNVNVIRPADGNETAAAWYAAMTSESTPTLLALTRQPLPVLAGSKEKAKEGVKRGAYVISPQAGDQADGLLIATGSEVHLAIEVQDLLKADGIDVAVVSMPNMTAFDAQDQDYKESVLPAAVTKRMTLEMGATYGWAKYAGDEGYTYGIDTFGASGPAAEVFEHFGFTAPQIAAKYKEFSNKIKIS